MFLTGAWFWRGFQSAIFYYVSCAPLSKFSYHRQKRKEYKRAKAENAMYEAEGGVHQHLAPFSTNPFWREEIVVGPGPPVRKAQREGKGLPEKAKQRRDRELRTGNSTETGTSMADTVVGEEGGEQVRDSGEGWNKRRYQREDEVLWGFDVQDAHLASLPPISRSTSGNKYQYYARNPAINDLHPPIVSTHPINKIEAQWMLQPPPKAKVMDGKERQTPENTPNRSRSTSGGSRISRGAVKRVSDMSLGRQVGERYMESKLKQGILPESPFPMSRGPSARSDRSTTSGKAVARDMDLLTRTRSNSIKREKQPPPISIATVPSLPSLPSARPPLSTIPSETLPQQHREKASHSRPQFTTANSASSLKAPQELITPSTKLNKIRSAPTPLDPDAQKTKLPPSTHQEDTNLQLPEIETCFPETGWTFPTTTNSKENRTKQLGHRWSMSI